MSASIHPRKTGVVKFFNSQKGFGFIIPHDKTSDNPQGNSEESKSTLRRFNPNHSLENTYTAPLFHLSVCSCFHRVKKATEQGSSTPL